MSSAKAPGVIESKSGAKIVQPGPAEARLLMDFEYDFVGECERIEFLRKVFQKSEIDLREEEMLKLELKKIQVQMRKLKNDTTLMTSESRLGEAKTRRGKNRKGKSGPTISPAEEAKLLKARLGPLSTDAPVYLRSVRLERVGTSDFGIGVKMSEKMRRVLLELGVPARPIPTKRVCDAYDKLQRDILTILAMKKQILPSHRARKQAAATSRRNRMKQESARIRNVPMTQGQKRATGGSSKSKSSSGKGSARDKKGGDSSSKQAQRRNSSAKNSSSSKRQSSSSKRKSQGSSDQSKKRSGSQTSGGAAQQKGSAAGTAPGGAPTSAGPKPSGNGAGEASGRRKRSASGAEGNKKKKKRVR